LARMIGNTIVNNDELPSSPLVNRSVSLHEGFKVIDKL